MSESREPAAPIAVVLVEDDRETREGLEALIDEAPWLRRVGSYESVEDAEARLNEDRPDVVLLDVHLPGMSGTSGVSLLLARRPTLAILMLTVFAEEETVFEAICNGAAGYLLKKTPPDRLLEAVRDAHSGGSPMSAEIAAKVVRLFRRVAPAPRAACELTLQERRLLTLLSDGHSYETAGEMMQITINTVRNHIRSIYDKLHVHSKSEAVGKAIRHGLIR